MCHPFTILMSLRIQLETEKEEILSLISSTMCPMLGSGLVGARLPHCTACLHIYSVKESFQCSLIFYAIYAFSWSFSPWSTPSCSESRSVPKEKDEAKPQRLDYRVGPLFKKEREGAEKRAFITFESCSLFLWAESGKSSSIVVLLLIDSGFG